MMNRVDTLIKLQDALDETAQSKEGYFAIDVVMDTTEDILNELSIEFKRRKMQRVLSNISDDLLFELIGEELTDEEFWEACLKASRQAKE